MKDYTNDDLIESSGSTEDQKRMLRMVDTGLQAQEFLNSTLGKKMCERSDADRAGLLEELVKVDATNTTAVQQLQLEIAVRDLWRGYVTQIINDGHTAGAQLLTGES